MTTNTYICLNSEFLKNNEPRIFTGNRAFRYGDAVTENIHAAATEPQFLPFHLDRLVYNMQLLSMDIPAFFTEQNLHLLINSLLNKNRIFGGAAVRLTVFRATGEDQVPAENHVSFLIESFVLKHDNYLLNERGLIVGISNDYCKPAGKLSQLPSSDALLFLMAGIESKKNNQDAVILLNTSGRLVETMNSNIFLVSGRSVFTPGINQGCIPGIMRKVIVEIAIEEGFQLNDQSSLTPAALLDAEEVFLTNTIEGIRWVGAYQQTRYFNKTARLFNSKLNERAFR